MRLSAYTTKKDGSGDIWIEDQVRFTGLPGRSREGILVIDADGLARGGELRLVGADGGPLTGFQVVRRGVAVKADDGSHHPILCD